MLRIIDAAKHHVMWREFNDQGKLEIVSRSNHRMKCRLKQIETRDSDIYQMKIQSNHLWRHKERNCIKFQINYYIKEVHEKNLIEVTNIKNSEGLSGADLISIWSALNHSNCGNLLLNFIYQIYLVTNRWQWVTPTVWLQ